MVLWPDNHWRGSRREGNSFDTPYDEAVTYPNFDWAPSVPVGPDGGTGSGGAPVIPVPAPLAGPPAAGNGGGGGGNGGGSGGGSMSASTRPMFHFLDAPVFHAPQFHAPTFAEAQQEPGYQFRLAGGSDALERSAAAKGVLRTGGTLKDLTEYGQNFASQEYGNVFNRALEGYDRLYRGAHDEFTPKFAEWQTLTAAEQAAAMAEWNWQHRSGGGGGGGGGGYNEALAAAPPPAGPPNGYIKPNHPYWGLNPNAHFGQPNGQGELWPERF